MKKYKSYYIDGVTFKNTKSIDTFLKEKAIKDYQAAVKLFMSHMDMESSIYVGAKAEVLVKEYGLTWEQVEQIEIGVMQVA